MKRFSKSLLMFTIFMWAFLSSLHEASGQTFRYELGRRLQRFERAWEEASVDARARSTQSMQAAVESFFSLQFKRAGKAVDEAWFQMRSEEGVKPVFLWAASRQVDVTDRVADASVGSLAIRIKPFYRIKPPAPVGTRIRVQLSTPGGELVAETESVWIATEGEAEDINLSWDASKVGAGDFQVNVDVILDSGKRLLIDRFLCSRVERLEQRMVRLPDQIEAVKESGTLTGYETLKLWREKIVASQKSERLEIDFPVARLFREIDSLLSLEGDSIEFVKSSAGREFWLRLRKERKLLPVRVQFSRSADEASPVLFVFHGAGGSDNMFFETYGAGRCVELARERGWIVISPDQGLLSRMPLDVREVLELVESHVAIDRSRVFLLGHSMGAGQVIRQANANPEVVTAAVALGGGSAMRNAKRVSRIPWYVAAGELDFGRRGARALVKSLEKVEAKVQYREFDDVEHMVIVQAALDDVFQFLDRVLRGSDEK